MNTTNAMCGIDRTAKGVRRQLCEYGMTKSARPNRIVQTYQAVTSIRAVGTIEPEVHSTPTAWTAIAQGVARNERNPGLPSVRYPRPNGADGGMVIGPDFRIGGAPCAPLGRAGFVYGVPRVSPWAISVGPVGAGSVQFAESARLEQAIEANLRGLGYGG